MEEIVKILPGLFRRQLQRADARVVEVLAPLWPHVAGEPMAERSRPVAFASGTLTLATDCSSWNTQLRQMAEEIRAEINSFLGRPVVKHIRVQRVARLDPNEWRKPPQARTPDIKSRRGEAAHRP